MSFNYVSIGPSTSNSRYYRDLTLRQYGEYRGLVLNGLLVLAWVTSPTAHFDRLAFLAASAARAWVRRCLVRFRWMLNFL